MTEEKKDENGIAKLKARYALLLNSIWLMIFSSWVTFADGGLNLWWYGVMAFCGCFIP